MNILILGSGGREHALARQIARSDNAEKVFIAPGNGGTSEVGENLNIDLSDFYEVAIAVKKYDIKMLVVGPEAPLVAGITDYFKGSDEFKDVIIIGPGKEGAKLEGSKDYAKEFMKRHGIPTAPYKSFVKGQVEDAKDFIRNVSAPYVLKADGLAAGKGVLIIQNEDEALEEIGLMLEERKFGAASEKVVIERFLDGIEMSVFAITDGENYLMLPSAKDYKRIGEGDTGLNTGGMGAVSPVPFADEELMAKIDERVVAPTVRGLSRDGIPYVGFIFFGLMIIDGDPFVIEYNVRMGDPETEVVLPRVQSDLLTHLTAAGNGRLNEEDLQVDPRFATTVMLVSGGYPEAYEKGKEISVPTHVSNDSNILFHAGTKLTKDSLVTSGGRVIACTGFGEELETALENSYALANTISFEGKVFRRDIGKDLIT